MDIGRVCGFDAMAPRWTGTRRVPLRYRSAKGEIQCTAPLLALLCLHDRLTDTDGEGTG